MPEFISITKEEYQELLDDQRLLHCLRAAGVDNWEGFDEAINLYHEDE
jgi:hypothetical protein